MDTIFARSTPPGRSGVAVVRLSGPESWRIVEALTRRALPEPRSLVLRNIWCEEGLVDTGMVVLFPNGSSFTGEQSAELHLHGSEAVVRRVLHDLSGFPEARPAGAGEFTHRALRNDKLDLSGVEGLGALLNAETEAQRQQAVNVLDGALRRRVQAWRAGLVQALGSLEVTVDFADEEVPDEVSADLVVVLRRLAQEMRVEADGAVAAGKISRGFEVAIVGAPNTGKSTLLNRLAGREAALTSEIAGTTRDIVEVRLEIAGQLVTLLDTAGVRDAVDLVERAGVDRALQRAASADLRVFIDEIPQGVSEKAGDIRVAGKADIRACGEQGLAVSGLTGAGVDRLLHLIGETLSGRVASAGVALTDRQASALSRGAGYLEEAASVLEAGHGQTEIAADVLLSGVRALDEVVGRIGVEDVLGEIFSSFCIGK